MVMVTLRKNNPPSQPRAIGALAVRSIIDKGRSLDAVLAQMLDASSLNDKDKAWVQELVYGMTRWYWHLEEIARQLLDRPVRRRDRDVHFLLLAGIYQLSYMRTPEHAAVSETVDACDVVGKPWAKRLINGCLRTFLRHPVSVEESFHDYSHPSWLGACIREAWPQHTESVLGINNVPPPMCLRVNTSCTTRSQYLEKLHQSGIEAKRDLISSVGLVLEDGVSVSRLPGFEQGLCSVQDTAAQIAAVLLDVSPAHRVLDACAAPGGKTGHILERTRGQADVTAIDSKPDRLALVEENLTRLGFHAACIAADAAAPHSWWDNTLFDRVLLDAPCSGTGVIRRHPDIRHHRRPEDLITLSGIQLNLLNALWKTLRPGGKLLYSTCSILPVENEHVICAFLEQNRDAREVGITISTAISRSAGVQTLQGVHPCDGFYYCLMEKLPGNAAPG